MDYKQDAGARSRPFGPKSVHKRMMKRFPRIRDVAAAAGVSTATVSRALSAPERVSQQTRANVLKAVEATGYRVNHAARNLRRRQAGGIVVLVPDLANPFFAQILSGIASAMAPAGYNVLIADTRQADSGARLPDYLHDGLADGLIVLDAGLAHEVLESAAASRRQPPIVFACEWIEDDDRPRVVIDNARGAQLAVDHLAGLGHRRIGHLMGPAGNVLTTTRAQGTRAALAAHGLEARAEWFLEGDFSLESGAQAARRWLAMEERPTAVFCASDAMACGFAGALQRQGVRIPRDISVVGFDGIDIAAHFVPALTTIAQPRRLIGETAARELVKLIRDSEAQRNIAQVLPLELVVRQSTAAPAQG